MAIRIGKNIEKPPIEVYRQRLHWHYAGFQNAKSDVVKIQCLRLVRRYAKAIIQELLKQVQDGQRQ